MSIILANSLDPDRVRQNVGPDLDPSCLSVMILMKECFKSFFLKDQHESSRTNLDSFVWFDSLRPINKFSVIKGRVFLD